MIILHIYYFFHLLIHPSYPVTDYDPVTYVFTSTCYCYCYRKNGQAATSSPESNPIHAWKDDSEGWIVVSNDKRLQKQGLLKVKAVTGGFQQLHRARRSSNSSMHGLDYTTFSILWPLTSMQPRNEEVSPEGRFLLAQLHSSRRADRNVNVYTLRHDPDVWKWKPRCLPRSQHRWKAYLLYMILHEMNDPIFCLFSSVQHYLFMTDKLSACVYLPYVLLHAICAWFG